MAYITLNKAHTHHKTTINGQPTSQYSRYETGLITGNKRDLPAILADSTGSDGYSFDSAVGSADDSWHVLNAFDKQGLYVDSIAVGGAMDADHATVVARTQLDSLGAANLKVIGEGLVQFDSINQSNAGTFSVDAINKLMDNPSQDKNYLPIITASELAYEADRVTFDSVEWGEGAELLSHDGRDSTLMLDMTRADTRSDLVNEFELADVLDLLGAEPEQSFDALMDTKNRLGLLKDRLYNAMSRAGNDTVSVTNVTETKPFKRQGVTNIAFVFDLSDGQKLSIWFHNPDSTPSKLMPSDIMISWKWMLNKRDVTAALSPKQGDNVQLPALASRIMRVAAKNSMPFKRTQAKRLKLDNELAEAKMTIENKTATIEQLDQDIASLNSQIDAAMKAPKVEPAVNNSDIEANNPSLNGTDSALSEKLNLSAKDLKAFNAGLSEHDTVNIDGYADKIKRKQKQLDDQGVSYVGQSEFQNLINNGDEPGLSEQKQKETIANLIKDAENLRDKKIGPSEIVGTGYKDARSVAFKWLAKTIKMDQEAFNGDVAGFNNIINMSNYIIYLGQQLSGSNNEGAAADNATDTEADIALARPSQMEELKNLRNLAPKSGEAIKSDDPDAIEKLEAKLGYLQAFAAVMRTANKHVRKGDDAALSKMGLNDKEIATLKEPDYAGRTGFADYQMTNNNGEMGRIKKRLKGLYRERELEQAENIDSDPASQPSQNMTSAEIDAIELEAFKAFTVSNDFWNKPTSVVQALSESDFNRLSESLTDVNYHKENAFFKAKRTGDQSLINKTMFDLQNSANEPLEDQLVTSVTDFAKTHTGFNGFIKNNNEAEAALAGKAKGDWVVAINDSKYPITVFMSLDDESSYTGATNSSIESAFNDILERTKDSAVLPAGYDVDTASNDEIINDTRIQSLITDLGLTLTSSENNEYEYGTKTDNSAFSFKLKHGELSTVYFVQNGDGSNLNNAMTEVSDIDGFITQAKDMHAKYMALLGEDNTPDPDNTPTNPNNKKIVKGKSNKAKTPKGTKIESVFALVDAKFLIASHTANGSKNPKYPQELQPRDRARESSIAWVQKTSRELDPESLGRTGRVDTGAPIVGDDLVVESGNGRTIAIKMAYANGDASEYREWLAENADMFGMTAKQVESYKQPILVRMRTTQVNRSEFAVEANQDDKLSFTASERAKSDAKRVNAGMLELFDPSESGDILAASNRPFVKSFLASLGATEAAQYTDSNGNPTQALVARIKGALFSKAYDDDRLLEMMADQTKPELQNTLNALTMAAPKFVAAQAVNRSDAQDLAEKVVDSVEQSLSDEVKNAIVDATNMIMNAKLSNQDIKEYVLQQGLFEQVDDATAELAVFLAANARSAKKMTEYFNAMASYIEQDSVSRQNLDMFGEPEQLSLANVIAHANNQVNDNTDTIGTLDMFNETVIDDTVTDEPVEPVAQDIKLTESLDDEMPSHQGLEKKDAVSYALSLLEFAQREWISVLSLEDAKDLTKDELVAQKEIDQKNLDDEWKESLKRIGHVFHNKSFKKDGEEIQDIGNQINSAYDRTKYGENPSQSQQLVNHWKVIANELAARKSAPLDDFSTANLAAKVDGIVNEINSSDFDPEIFDVDALSAIAVEAEGNSELTAKLEAASEVYQNKLMTIAMQAMSDMAGN